MVETLATSGAVKHRAGTNASTTVINSGTWMTEFINQAEGDITAETRVNWVNSYSGLNANWKQVLEGACAAKAAIKVINYDMSGFTNLQEATTMVNVLWAEYNRAINILKDDKVITSLGGAFITN